MAANSQLGLSLGRALSGAYDPSGYRQGQRDAAQAELLRTQNELGRAKLEGAQRDLSRDPAEFAALQLGVDKPMADALLQGFKSGGNYGLGSQDKPNFMPDGLRDLSNSSTPEYVKPQGYSPELENKFRRTYGAIKQGVYAGEGNPETIYKGLQEADKAAFLSGAQTPTDVAVRNAATKGNAADVWKLEKLRQLSDSGASPEQLQDAARQFMVLDNKPLYDFSENGVGDNVTGQFNIGDIGRSKVDVNQSKVGSERALAAQRTSAAGLNNANVGLVTAKTANERNKPVSQAPATADGKTYSNKPLPTPALKLQQEELETIGAVSGTNADLAALQKQVQDGTIKLGPVDNLWAGAKNSLGISDESSQGYQTLIATLEKARNSSLLLNKGVQTDGDAQRAWNELLTNLNDPKVVAKRLQEIQNINNRAISIRKAKVANLRRNYDAPPLDFSEFDAPKTSIESGKKEPSVSNW